MDNIISRFYFVFSFSMLASNSGLNATEKIIKNNINLEHEISDNENNSLNSESELEEQKTILSTN